MKIEVQTFKRNIKLDGKIISIAENSVIKNNLLVVSEERKILNISLNDFRVFECFNLPETKLDYEKPLVSKISPSERFCVIGSKYGQFGIVIDLELNEIILELSRGGYCVEHCYWAIEFFELNNQEYLIHNTDWNRLDITNLNTKEVITKRKIPEHTEPHYLDYFHSGISVSPNKEWIVDNGWHWHPWGVLTAWSLEKWLDNIWESEDGESKFDITSAAYFWDRPICWSDDNTVVYWGVGDDDEEMEDSVVIFDLLKKEAVKIINGIPIGELFFDDYLFCNSLKKGLSIWDIETSDLMYSNENIKTETFIKFEKGFIINISKNEIDYVTLKF